jgi:glycosyltransferase involved in cell wall biosynthesis
MLEKNLLRAATFSPDLIDAPSAWIGHTPIASLIISSFKPKIFVELGTHWGHSYFAFCQAIVEAQIKAKCYAVDTWEGDEHAGKYTSVYESVFSRNQKNYSGFSQLLRTTFDKAVECFSDGSIDILHIDGFHTYEAVKNDFLTWKSKLSHDAIVIFHDVNVRERGFGVWKFWDELKKEYSTTFEVPHFHGLGILRLGTNDSQDLSWMGKSPTSDLVGDYLFKFGKHQIERYEIEALKSNQRELDQENLSLRNEVAESVTKIFTLNSTISGILSSTSWRITKPMRRTSSCINFAKLLLVKGSPERDRYIRRIKKIIEIYNVDGAYGVAGRVYSYYRNSGASESIDQGYKRWVRRYSTLNKDMAIQLSSQAKNFSVQPLISIVMPTYNSNIEWLGRAIDSVCKQIYQNWELCISDDCSSDPRVRALLEIYASKDKRIKIDFRSKNGHIAVASNSAAKLAAGDWIAFLDHDDLLSSDALFWIAESINANPKAVLIYSDEDKVDGDDRRHSPHFKTDWNPFLLLSQNMICHFVVYRASVFWDVGGLREGFEGSQDYDLALRVTENLERNQIVHIPRILYHWRAHDGSTSKSTNQKNYSITAGVRALNDHLARMKIEAVAEATPFGMYRVKFKLPLFPPKVSIIILTKNKLSLIKTCVESIVEKTTYLNYEIIIVDNNSDEPEVIQYLGGLTNKNNIRVLRDSQPFNYSSLNNQAVKVAQGDYLVLMNNDVEVISPGWLSEMVSLAIQPSIGAVGAKLLYPDDSIQHAGVIVGIGGVAAHIYKNLPCDAMGYFGRAQLLQGITCVTAACLLVKRSIYQEVGGLDEENLKVAFNDVDFCLKIHEAGYENIWTPYALLYHHESASRGYEDTPEKMQRFNGEVNFMKERWGKRLMEDPFYSPNLTLDHPHLSLAFPPRV